MSSHSHRVSTFVNKLNSDITRPREIAGGVEDLKRLFDMHEAMAAYSYTDEEASKFRHVIMQLIADG